MLYVCVRDLVVAQGLVTSSSHSRGGAKRVLMTSLLNGVSFHSVYSGLQKVCLPQTYKHINISAALWDPFCEEFYGSTPLQDKNVL